MSTIKRSLLIFLLLACFFVQSFISISSKSATFDEVQYFGIGKYLLLNHKWDIAGSIMHPPLAYYLNSLPLFSFHENKRVWEYEQNNRDLTFLAGVDTYRGQELLSDPQNANDRLLIRSRLMTLLLSLLLGIYIYRFSSDLYGYRGGLLSLFLFAFCPNMLASSGLITPDMPLTVFSFIAIYHFWLFLKAPVLKTALPAGISLGLALASKFTAVLLIPVELIIYAVYLLREKKRPAGYVLLLPSIACFIFSFSYGFDLTPFFQGMEYKQIQVAEGFEAFFHGSCWESGWWWYYYPAVILLKTPIPVLALLGAATVLYLRERRREWFEWFILALPAAVIFAAFAGSKIYAGVRYLLPMYPFIFVVIGALTVQWINRRRLIYTMAIWHLGGALFIAPHYLAYFNETIGGPENGYKFLVDSNLDWGQDLKGLKKYMDANGIERVSLSYFGIDSPKRYGIVYDWLPSHHLYNPAPEKPVDAMKNRFVAISATNLQGVFLQPRDMYVWLRQYEPVARIGYSIFVYDLKKLRPIGGS